MKRIVIDERTNGFDDESSRENAETPSHLLDEAEKHTVHEHLESSVLPEALAVNLIAFDDIIAQRNRVR